MRWQRAFKRKLVASFGKDTIFCKILHEKQHFEPFAPWNGEKLKFENVRVKLFVSVQQKVCRINLKSYGSMARGQLVSAEHSFKIFGRIPMHHFLIYDVSETSSAHRLDFCSFVQNNCEENYRFTMTFKNLKRVCPLCDHRYSLTPSGISIQPMLCPKILQSFEKLELV